MTCHNVLQICHHNLLHNAYTITRNQLIRSAKIILNIWITHAKLICTMAAHYNRSKRKLFTKSIKLQKTLIFILALLFSEKTLRNTRILPSRLHTRSWVACTEHYMIRLVNIHKQRLSHLAHCYNFSLSLVPTI